MLSARGSASRAISWMVGVSLKGCHSSTVANSDLISGSMYLHWILKFHRLPIFHFQLFVYEKIVIFLCLVHFCHHWLNNPANWFLVPYLETQLPLWPDWTKAVVLEEAESGSGSRWWWQGCKVAEWHCAGVAAAAEVDQFVQLSTASPPCRPHSLNAL